MFECTYIKGTTVPPFDAAITASIEEFGIDGGGKPMKIAVENFDGKVYRTITSVGLGAYMHITSALLALDMKDLLADSIYGKDGYDSWFVPTTKTLQIVPSQVTVANDPATEILSEIGKLDNVPETERQALILSRVGQGAFRDQLVSYWKGCAVTGANCILLLRASHIKPWRASNNTERLDMFNGLLLSPNLDAAFDSGYITFDSHGKIILSNAISGTPAFQLHINAKMRINQKQLREEHKAYLEFHRSEVFRG